MMKSVNVPRLVWGALAPSLLGLVAAFGFVQFQRHAAHHQIIWLNYPLPEFTLTNQDGRIITLSDLRGQVWIADIVFTRCAGPCPLMTKRLSQVQGEFAQDKPVRFVTLTTDPDYDTPAVMRRFGQKFNADFSRWLFLTGNKQQIAKLAIEGMKLVATQKDPEQRENERDLFIHSTRFVLVDKQGVVCASFDSTDPQTKARLKAAVRKLLRE